MASSSSTPNSAASNSLQPTTAPSSPLAAPEDLDTDYVEPEDENYAASSEELQRLKLLQQEEERARTANEKAERKRRAALKQKAKKKKTVTPAEREARARGLDQLLQQSQAFSDILVQSSGGALGQIGSGLGGKALGDHDLEIAKQPQILTGGTMRDYQLEGLTWLMKLCEQGLSGILADEMGLGA